MFLSANFAAAGSLFFPPNALFPHFVSTNAPVPPVSGASLHSTGSINTAPHQHQLATTTAGSTNPFLQLPYAAKSHYWLAAAAAAAAASRDSSHESLILSALAKGRENFESDRDRENGKSTVPFVAGDGHKRDLSGSETLRNFCHGESSFSEKLLAQPFCRSSSPAKDDLDVVGVKGE